jgi:DNA repair protein RadA/Sms
MAKIKTSFFCQNCGAQSAKWIGRCPACGEWNTYVEEVLQRDEVSTPGNWKATTSLQVAAKPRAIAEIRFQ